jgi:hypothetical protein
MPRALLYLTMSNKDDLTHKEYVSENVAGVFVEDPALERRFVGHPPIFKDAGINDGSGFYGRSICA